MIPFLIAVVLLLAATILMYRQWFTCIPRYSSCARRVERLERSIVDVPRVSRLYDAASADLMQQAPLGVETMYIQVQYARHRLPELRKASILKLQKFQLELGRIERDLRTLRAGKDPYKHRNGAILRAHYSDIDDTLQPFSIAVPRSYDGTRAFPLIIRLHAHGWFRPFQGHPASQVQQALVLSPHGRGSTDYMHIGERDVLAALETTRRVYNIDDDRVYLMGHSMGGTGCWQLAAHHPELFAAIAPTAGNTDHTVWEEKWGWDAPESYLLPVRRKLEMALDPITYAANLKDVPVFCAHGANDPIVPVEHSRNMVRKLRELGCAVRYEELPDVEHGDFPDSLFDEQIQWLLQQRRPAKAASAKLCAEDILEWQKNRTPSLPGPIENAFLSPFLIVYGTSSVSEIDNIVCRREAEQFVREWERRYGNPCRIKADHAVSEADMRRFTLVLYGNPKQNSVLAQFVDEVPLRFRGRQIVIEAEAGFRNATRPEGNSSRPETTIDTVRWERALAVGDDAGIEFCLPNPKNPSRYLVVMAGVTWRGLFQINGRFGNWFDWGVYDNRRWFDYAAFDGRSVDPEGMVGFGFFDRHWHFRHETYWKGDDTLRSRVVPHQPPACLHPPAEKRAFALSDLMPVEIDQEKGTVELNRSFRSRPLQIGNREFTKGLGVRAPSRIVYDLKGDWSRFRATVGLDAEGEHVSAARREVEAVAFIVKGDGRILSESPEIDCNSAPHTFDVSVTGVRQLELITDPRDGHLWLFGSAAWGDVEVGKS